MRTNMAWTDRDYAKWTDEERDRFYGQGSVGARRSPGVVLRRGVGWAIIASAVLFGLGHFPSGHPILPVPHFSLRGSHSSTASTRPVGPISMPSTAALGSTFTFRGTAPPGNGPVAVEGSYDGGQTWRTLSTVSSANGSYAAEITLRERGTLQIRIRFADGSEAVGSLVVS
jgi:hypothetical protein